jgi:hypothetical protein
MEREVEWSIPIKHTHESEPRTLRTRPGEAVPREGAGAMGGTSASSGRRSGLLCYTYGASEIFSSRTFVS